MKTQTEQHKQISKQFFSKCSDLQFIAEPYDIKEAPEQLKRRDLATEFELIRALTQTKKHKTLLRSNSILENKRNRYPEQSIYQHCRVKLPIVDDQEQSYINANIIPLFDDKKVIITQAPLQSTQQHFEEMLKMQNIQCVIMLCNILQNGKVRCFDYCENRDKEIVREISDYATIKKVTFEVEERLDREVDEWEKDNKQKEKYTYTHIHYSEWPDRGLPFEPRQLRQIVLQALKFDNIVIHCSAGLGRSGVMAAVIYLELKALVGDHVSVFEVVRRIREYRYGSVQNNEQYKFIYEYVCELSKQRQ